MGSNIMGINLFDNIDKLLFTLGIIVTTTFLISQVLAKLGKPIAMAGIVAGFILQNLHLSDSFFKPKTCNAVGMLGIVFFMMLVGSQLNYHSLIKRKINIVFSSMPLIIPFIVGYLCAAFIIHIHLAPAIEVSQKDEILFKIFFALAISMTAFPLLSMFLANNSKINPKIAHVALFCATINEILFWIILGIVLLYFQYNPILVHFRPIYIIFYLLFMFGVAPRLINYIVSKITTLHTMLGFVIAGCLLSASLADLINLHQVFGAFIFGILLPRDNPLIKEINTRLSDLVNSLLLPAYFFETGMNANLNLIFNPTIIFLTLLISAVAILSKIGGAIITGKMMGYTLSESTLLGSLLNLRGVFEIMLLNVGLDVGIINNQLYTILIIMTLITTVFSTTLSPWLNKFIKSQEIK